MNKEKGQALLFVVVSLTIAMAVGISISLRTLSSISRTTRSDTASRVLAAAEGGAERFLSKTPKELADSKVACPNYATSITHVEECIVTFNNTSDGDPVVSRAVVSVGDISGDSYAFKIKKDDVREVRLSGQNALRICWSPIKTSSTSESDLYVIAYGKRGVNYIYNKQGFSSGCTSGCYTGGYTKSGDFEASAVSTVAGYSWCVNVGSGRFLADGPEAIRIRSLANDSKVIVLGSSLPVQGYKITSVGEIEAEGSRTSKTVVVYKSLPYLPALFDYALYTE